MITGELRNQVDRIWDAFWSGGISNPLEVIEQITYLLFLRRLDELQTLEESKARQAQTPYRAQHIPGGQGCQEGCLYDELSLVTFQELEAREMLRP